MMPINHNNFVNYKFIKLGTRPHLKVTRMLDRCGIQYSLSKYLPTKDNLFSVGKIKHLKITENYLIINLSGDLDKFQYSMYFDSPYNSLVRLVQYHEETYKIGLPCINPKNNKPSFLIYEKGKIIYKIK